MYLAKHLVTRYGQDKKVTDLLDNLEFLIVPMANPDGIAVRSIIHCNCTYPCVLLIQCRLCLQYDFTAPPPNEILKAGFQYT